MRKAVKLLSALVIISLLFSSCKKKKKSSSEETEEPGPVPTTSLTPFFYWGSFEHNLARGDSSATNYYGTIAFASAGFFDVLYRGSEGFSYIDGGTISINGVAFTKQIIGTYANYFIPGSLVPTSPSQWLCSGNGTVPAISFNDNTPWPTYSGQNVLPDTIKTGYNNIILIQGIGGADEIQVNLASGLNWFQKVYAANTNAVFVTPLDLSVLQTWNPGFMQIILRRKTIHVVNGKPYQFIRAYTWNHNVYYK